MKSIACKLLVLLLVLSQLCCSTWSQELEVKVSDLNGIAVENAEIEIIFQELNSLSEDDGLVAGYTDENGSFSASLENKIPEFFESRKIQVRALTYYWEGQLQEVYADESGMLSIPFTAPVELEKLRVRVFDSGLVPIEGADAVITGKRVTKKVTDSKGNAVFYLPPGYEFEGFVSYENLSKKFTSSEVLTDWDGKIIATMLFKEAKEYAPEDVNNTISIRIIPADGSAFSGMAVEFEVEGEKSAAYTDSEGIARFGSNKSGNVSVSFTSKEHRHIYTFNLTGASEHTINAPYLLNISSFSTVHEGDGCFMLAADISDPRAHLPIEVKISRYGPTEDKQLLVSTNDAGMFISRICITEETQLVVSASNKYESAEKIITVSPVPKEKPEEKPVEPEAEGKAEEPQPNLGEVLLSLVALAIVLALILAFFIGKRHFVKIVRFIGEYLRQVLKNMQKKRRRKPIMPPFEE